MDFLLPRETRFFTFLAQMGDLLVTGCITFRDLVVQIEGLSEDDVKKRLFSIKDCEQKGDRLEVAILDQLESTFLTPIDREDIETLTIQIDKCLDILNSLSRKIEIYHITQVPMNVVKFADIIVALANLSRELVDDLVAKRDVRKKAEAMHKLENQGDDLFHLSTAELFAGSEKYQTIETTIFKELYEQLEVLVDSIDFFGKQIRGIRMKHG